MRGQSYRFRHLATMSTALLALAVAAPGGSQGQRATADRVALPPASRAVVSPVQARAVYARLPLAFQALPRASGRAAQFGASGSGYGLLLTPTGATLALQAAPLAVAPHHGAARLPAAAPRPPAVVRLQWTGAAPHPRGSGLEALPGKVNRYVGRDPQQWQCGGVCYAKVRYSGVYPGIDLIYYGSQRQLEYDWRIAPGADPGRIRLAVQGAGRVSVDARGELLIRTAEGTLCQPRPRVYQERGGRRTAIAGGYVLKGKDEVGFQVGPYDRGQPLVIDPTLVYASFLGGAGLDQGFGIAVDGAGSVVITGTANLPTLWPTTRGAAQAQPSALAGGTFVTKLDLTKAGAAALVYSTYLGTADLGTGIAVDPAGNAYVSGFTFDATLPVTPGAFQPRFGQGTEDGFAAKLSPTGTLVYATYLGATDWSEATGVAVDPAGNAYLIGGTGSPNFPTTPNAFQRGLSSSSGHAFVMKLDPTGKPIYSTLLGGSQNDYGDGIAVDGAGNAYVTGYTYSPDFPTTANAIQRQLSASVGGAVASSAFVTKLSPTGTPLYSTFLGGPGTNGGYGIAVNGAQEIYVTGRTLSSAFPVTPGAFQPAYRGKGYPNAFVARISAAGALVYSTYLGGSGSGSDMDKGGDQGNAIAVDAAGDAFVTGRTRSPDFPVTPGSIQTALGHGPSGQLTADAFMTILEPQGKFLYYSTYLGGSGDDEGDGIAADGNLNVYLVGTTDSGDFHTTAGAVQPAFGGDQNTNQEYSYYEKGGVVLIEGDAFVAKIALK